MFSLSFVWFALLSIGTIQLATGGPAFDSTEKTECVNVPFVKRGGMVVDKNNSEQVCFTRSWLDSPPGAYWDDGYHNWTFQIWDLPANVEPPFFNSDEYHAKKKKRIDVKWSLKECLSVHIDGQQCRNCMLCPSKRNNPKMVADCRNVPGGRWTRCSEVQDTLFYPIANA